MTDPGLHFKIPFIQQVKKVNTTIQGFSIGYNNNESIEDESLMITSDFNFIDVDFYVEYRYSVLSKRFMLPGIRWQSCEISARVVSVP